MHVSGFDNTPVEITGRIIGKRAGEWLFYDGIGKRWLPREYVRYRPLEKGYCVLTLPQWLWKKRSFRRKGNGKRSRSSKTATQGVAT